MAIKKVTYVIEVNTQNGTVKIDGLTKGFVKAELAAKKLNATMVQTANSSKQMAGAAGLAGAVAVEAGRTISDMNYGLTAVANNLSQLSTLFVTLTAKAGGFRAAMKLLLMELMGPVGLIIALQILITAMESAAMAEKAAEDAAGRLTRQFEGLRKEIEKILGLNQRYVDRQKEIVVLEQDLLDLKGADNKDYIAIFEVESKLIDKKIELLKFELETRKGALTPKEELQLQIKIYELERARARLKVGSGKGGDRDKLPKIGGDLSSGLSGVFGKGNKLLEALIGTSNEDELKASATEAWKGIADAFAAGSEDEGVKQYWYAMMEERKGFYLDMIMPFYDQSVDLLLARYDRELTIEQNATNEKNNELRKRLQNENLSSDQRKKIQLQIAKNDEELRLKQEKIEEKRFNMQKAANIGTAMIETYLAATKALNQFGGAPFGLGPMFATIALGLANVATIASQKFQSSASSAPFVGAFDVGGGSGGGNEPQSPDFNVIGSSGRNQIAAAINRRLDKPVKTYITSKDVRTGAELDRNIVDGSVVG